MIRKKPSILMVSGWPLRIGGNNKSMLAHVKNLKKLGLKIFLMLPPDNNVPEMLKAYNKEIQEIFYFKKPFRGRYVPKSSGYEEICETIRENNIDIIHAQNFQCLTASAKAAAKTRKPLVWTKAGGPVNTAFAPDAILSIFYSQELKDEMCRQYHLNPDTKYVIRARIDTEVFKPLLPDEVFVNNYNLPAIGRNIFMAIRIEHTKRPWLENIMNFADNYYDTSRQVNIIVAGEGLLLEEMKARAEKMNKKNGCRVRFIGPVFGIPELVNLYNYADIVVGNGRGIMEAMACRKPVVILGEKKQAQVLGTDNIQSVARYNFSGRHFRHKKENISTLEIIIKEFLFDDAKLSNISDFSYKYVLQNLAAMRGAEEILGVYEKSKDIRISCFDYYAWLAKYFKVLILRKIKSFHVRNFY